VQGDDPRISRVAKDYQLAKYKKEKLNDLINLMQMKNDPESLNRMMNISLNEGATPKESQLTTLPNIHDSVSSFQPQDNEST